MKTFTNSMMALVLAIGFTIVGSANAVVLPINILNPDLEADAATDGQFFEDPTDWTELPFAGWGDPTEAMIPGQGGDINNMAWLQPDGSLYQDLVYGDLSPVLIGPGQTYTITADFGRRADTPQGDSPVEIQLIETSGFTTLASVTYQVGNQALGSISNQTFTLTTGLTPAGLGSQARLQFHLFDDFVIPSSDQALFDNVSATVEFAPEPSTFALLTVGLVLVRKYARKAGRGC